MTMKPGGADEPVSVIIAAFNSESYIAEALASVFAQDWAPLEVILSDDGSTDDTVAIARHFGTALTIVHGSDDGVAATRNRGTATAHGTFVLHLDADDLLVPQAIRTLMGVFHRDDSCDIAAGRFASFVSPELPGDVSSRFSAPDEPQPGHLSGVALVRADVFARVGPLDDRYQPASEVEWWLRARDQGVGIHLIDDVILRRRIHDKNSSLRDRRSFNEVSLRIAREALQRKRAGSS